MDSLKFNITIHPFLVSLGIHGLVATVLYFGGLGQEGQYPARIGGGTFEIIGFQKTSPQTDKKSKNSRLATLPDPTTSGKKEIDQGSHQNSTYSGQTGFQSYGGGGRAYNEYVQNLYNQLEQNKRYPLFARKLKVQGIVKVRFRVLRDGTIQNIQITQPSSSEILNRAAIDSLRKSSGHSPLPESLKGRFIEVETSFHFSTSSR